MERLTDILNINYTQNDELNKSILDFIKYLYITNQLNNKSEQYIYNMWLEYTEIPQWYEKNNIIYIKETCKLIEKYKKNIDKYPINTHIQIKDKYRNNIEYILTKILFLNKKYIKDINKYNEKQLLYLLKKYFYINNNKKSLEIPKELIT